MKESRQNILVLGGMYQHCKLVEAAHDLGMSVCVTDYVSKEKSPAKQMADISYDVNIFDIDALAEICKKEKIDGVIASYLDPCQKPYQELCERLNYHCFATRGLTELFTSKKMFKNMCTRFGVDIIPEYTHKDVLEGNVQYPILIKPSDARGSRGVSICNSHIEAEKGIESALLESNSKEIIIEKYMGQKNDLQIVYLVVDGQPKLYKIEDRYLGPQGSGLENLCIASVSPSKIYDTYMENVDGKVVNMLKQLEIENAPIFLQGIWDENDNTVRFYDPGIRFPGNDYDLLYKKITGIDIPKALVQFSITGELSSLSNVKPILNVSTALLFPDVLPGKIKKIKGIDIIKNNESVVKISNLYNVDDIVPNQFNIKQRFAEIDIACDDKEELRKIIAWIKLQLQVIDENGKNLIFAEIDEEKIW